MSENEEKDEEKNKKSTTPNSEESSDATNESNSEDVGEDDDDDIDDVAPEDGERVKPLMGMYQNYFLDYASYVILERAVPMIEDGLKPVQRRILHSMREMEDGRYNKVANVIGNTMKYHPHGDASIGDAMVQIGQKDLLIDTQGNWGNVLTGDRAAAPRYIEARLSKFGLEVVFNPKTTEWQSSYDGRNREPVTLPVKFPLLLAHGGEGIAVGLATKLLPHNFIELIDACIGYLRGKKVSLVPDFPTGGMMDASQYNDGLRGGRVRVRAKITQLDKKTLCITEIPFATTTTSLIDSIIKASDRGKIKIRKIEDNTAENVEIMIHLPSGVSPDRTIDALYAFTDCEVSLSPNSCVINGDTPVFLGVSELLKHSADQTVALLKLELEIRLAELQEQWHFLSLEKIFIEKRIYRDIEECETWEDIILTIRKGLQPHIKHLLRQVTDEDIERLTEIKIKRISKFDSKKSDDKLLVLEGQIEEVKHHLSTIIDYTVDYYKSIKDKYGKGKERKTEIKSFDVIQKAKVAVANAKLYIDRKEGFVGTNLRKSDSEFVCDCSDIDNVIVFNENGSMIVSKVSDKAFFGKGIIHVGIWKKNDKRRIYNMIYTDGGSKNTYMKRFAVTSITRDKEYWLTKSEKGSKVLYFSANPNGEAEVVTVIMRSNQKLKKQRFDIDFSELAIKGRGAGGNLVTKYAVNRVELKEKGVSTLGARKIWFDDTVQRLNTEERGKYLGAFSPSDKILTVMAGGYYKLTGFDLSTHFDPDMLIIEKWDPRKPLAVVYFDADKQYYYVKRFLVESSTKPVGFIGDNEENQLAVVSSDYVPVAEILFRKTKGKDRETEDVNLTDFIAIKGLKVLGNRLTAKPVTKIELKESLEPGEDLMKELYGEEWEKYLNPSDDDTESEEESDEDVEEIESESEEEAEAEAEKPVEAEAKTKDKAPAKPIVEQSKQEGGAGKKSKTEDKQPVESKAESKKPEKQVEKQAEKQPEKQPEKQEEVKSQPKAQAKEATAISDESPVTVEFDINPTDTKKEVPFEITNEKPKKSAGKKQSPSKPDNQTSLFD